MIIPKLLWFKENYVIVCILFEIIMILNDCNGVNGLSKIFNKQQKNFLFPDSNNNDQTKTPAKDNENIQSRQLVSGRVTTTASSLLQQITCICVPTGQCYGDIGSGGGPSDGSGVFDVRIVNPYQYTTDLPSFQCLYGLEVCCTRGPYQCGKRYSGIPNSPITTDLSQAPFGSFPWQAVILTASDEVYLGSGTLIDDSHILTAAHKINNLPTNSFKIRLGEWDASNTNEPIPAEEYSISQVFIHPQFNPNNLQNDIAIIRLSSNIMLGKIPTIATSCLPSNYFVGQTCYVAGWGKDDFGPNGKYQAIQKMVDVKVQTQDYCQTSLSKTKLGSQFIFNRTSFICAGGEFGKDACTGDGGSPLVCESNGRWYVTGLVAWGIGCAMGGIPGVYVNVLSYIPWIQSVVKF